MERYGVHVRDVHHESIESIRTELGRSGHMDHAKRSIVLRHLLDLGVRRLQEEGVEIIGSGARVEINDEMEVEIIEVGEEVEEIAGIPEEIPDE
jgi:hypothetical protein